jgi:hypothetical protein
MAFPTVSSVSRINIFYIVQLCLSLCLSLCLQSSNISLQWDVCQGTHQ